MGSQLFTFNVNNCDPITNYCNLKLHPYISKINKEYQECSLNKMKHIFSKCKASLEEGIDCDKCNKHFVNIDEFITHSEKEYGFHCDEKFLLDINPKQRGGTNISNHSDFSGRLTSLEEGGFECPNGVKVYPDGHVDCSNDSTNSSNELVGGKMTKFKYNTSDNNVNMMNKLLKRGLIENSETYKWLHSEN